ncbi:TIGR04104 family putative zinc finger protein [Thalassobacillus devorans]|nr:TIGR04104 family putative zinc finger protein [Thalassobacillus devorans]
MGVIYMPVCDHCKKKWTWKETVFSKLMLSSSAPCPYCGEKQYASAKTRKRGGIMVLSVIIPMFIVSLFDFSMLFYILFGLIVFFIVMGLSPFYYELSSKEESLW